MMLIDYSFKKHLFSAYYVSGVYLQFQANEFLLNKNKMETCQLVSGIKETDGWINALFKNDVNRNHKLYLSTFLL